MSIIRKWKTRVHILDTLKLVGKWFVDVRLLQTSSQSTFSNESDTSSFFLNECQRPTWGMGVPAIVDLNGIHKSTSKNANEQVMRSGPCVAAARQPTEFLLSAVTLETILERSVDATLGDNAKRRVCRVKLPESFWICRRTADAERLTTVQACIQLA